MKNKRLVNISSRAFMVVCLVVLMTGCFDDRKAMFEHQLLEWEPINRATNTLSTNVSLEIDEVEDKTIHLRMQYAGPHVSHAVTGRFDLLPAESTAVEGKHFQINGQKALTVPPQSSHSNEVELVILSGA